MNRRSCDLDRRSHDFNRQRSHDMLAGVRKSVDIAQLEQNDHGADVLYCNTVSGQQRGVVTQPQERPKEEEEAFYVNVKH